MRYYAGIGSRETPEEILALMTRVGKGLMRKGYVLRSGGAEGADKAFEVGIPSQLKEIYFANQILPCWALVFTDYFHPAPAKLSSYARRLMNRNALQILGKNGDTPVDFVVCWTKDGKASGGTGHAIRIAEYFGIPVFNLRNEGAKEALMEFVNETK
jgi:hypothetical protein